MILEELLKAEDNRQQSKFSIINGTVFWEMRKRNSPGTDDLPIENKISTLIDKHVPVPNLNAYIP